MEPVVTRTFAADHVTPVRAYAGMRAAAPERSSFLLESVVPGERWGRYSILGYRARNEVALPAGGDAIAALADDLARAPALPADLDQASTVAARFLTALVGFVAYDAGNPIHRVEPWPDEGDLARFCSEATVAVFDNLRQTMTVAGRSRGAVERCAWEMTHGPELAALPTPDPTLAPEHVDASMSDEAFAAKVARIQRYVRAGDAQHVVLARRFSVPLREADPFDVYRALRVLSPSPYLYFLDFSETPMSEKLVVIGASPATMVRVRGETMTLRPISGRRPRGGDEAEDRRWADELAADPKERSEHVMLVDLARDDLGRVCTPGSVTVDGAMTVERCSHVMHLVSEVTGRLRPDAAGAEVVRAAFPAGTLSGAPKVRATQIIRELEPTSRGIYGGAVGYVAGPRDIDLAIALRTVVMRRGYFEVGAGAGVVDGSAPEAEAEETRNEARAALAAIRAAQDAVVAREEAAQKRAAALAEKAAKDAAAKDAAAETSEG